MTGNKNLQDSSRNKQDEFYTPISLIENELIHYREHFRGKVILCNCDDPYESNFFKYFALNFNFLGLKKLVATCYVGSPIADTQLSLFDHEPKADRTTRAPHKIEITEVTDENGDGAVDLTDVEYLLGNKKNALTRLSGDGDFRSAECIELLKEADVVVTNPPFSLFREYVGQLAEHEKSFIIIGNQNAVTYKEIFKLIKEDKLWMGYMNGHFWFKVPDTYEEKPTDFKIDEDGQKWRRMGNICWFTNLDIKKRHELLMFYKKYNPKEYPHYDNYDAINVNLVTDIPEDWTGVMGVPITLLSKYNPDQFEIIKFRKGDDEKDLSVNGKYPYFRVLVRRIGDIQ